MLYAIGDLHLSLAVDKPMDVFGGAWEGYLGKIEQGLSNLTADDTLILAGDTSWGMSLQDALADFQFLERFPCKKVLLKGNHDYFWDTAAKMNRFFAEHGLLTFDILHNNAFFIDGFAVCGTRGWFFEEERGGEHDTKMINREAGRLRASLEAGRKLGGELTAFLHYPPLYEGYRCEPLVEVLEEYGVKRCFFGHLHGRACARAIEGLYRGIGYRLISADHVGFTPVRVAG
ncbi:MAG: metallophosphoesterase [Oscillospiraceae bacterium]|nr:metallophosphoesterase [Oscillospiraceae bacterium]